MTPAQAFWVLYGAALGLAATVGVLVVMLYQQARGRRGRHSDRWRIAGAGDGEAAAARQRLADLGYVADEASAVPRVAGREAGAAATEAEPGAPAPAGPDSAAAPPFLAGAWWCERRWHDGTCCPASAEQYGLAERAFLPPAEADGEGPGAAAVAEIPAGVAQAMDAYAARIKRLDALPHRQLLDLAIAVAAWDGELVDQALRLLDAEPS